MRNFISLSRAREGMHVYTRDKAALCQSVMHPGERKSVWELVETLGRLKPQSRDPIMPAFWMAPHAEIVREMGNGTLGGPLSIRRSLPYKAFDVDLRRTVTLKVINEKYLGDAPAQLRFLREARSAASVRHPNVASVFHLGKTGSGYFYAMEFVEGETLEKFIKRSGCLEVNVALEIVAQVTAGTTSTLTIGSWPFAPGF